MTQTNVRVMIDSRMLRRGFIALLLTILPCVAAAQSPVSVTGLVVESGTTQPVSGAVLDAAGVRTTTGADGRFVLALPIGPLRLMVSATGFLEQRVDLIVVAAMPTVEIVLVRAPPLREEVTVAADASAATPAPATIAIPPAAILRIAGAGDNVFKALQTLPGISATDDFGSRLAVRGGGPDQNLTMMDGVEIHNPYRLFGLTSAFNPETVDRFELTAGGFGAEYGDRLSSILIVENRAGTMQQGLAGSAALSLTDANIVVEGRLPGRTRGSWLVTGRRTYYDLVADRITGNDLPSFGDLQARTVWDVRPGHTLTFFALRSRERTDATFLDAGDTIDVGNDSRNDLVSFTYRAAVTSRTSSRTTMAWYDYGDGLAVDGSVRDGARRSNRPGPDYDERSAIIFTRDMGVRDLSLRQQVDTSIGAHVLSIGGEAHALRTVWGWTIAGDRPDAVANGSSVLGGSGLPSLLQSARRTTRGALWLADRIQAGRRLRIEPGLRVDVSGLSGEVIAAPRVAMDFELGPRTRLKGAAGLFTQSPGYEKLLQSDYFVDLTAESAADVRSERAIHAIVALERVLSASTTVKVEAYSKRFSRMIIGRLETPGEVAARIARYDFPAEFATSIPNAPSITSVPANGGGGHAYGVDLFVQKRQRGPTDRLFGWASYTWGRANQEAYGQTRPFDYDRRHSASVVASTALASRVEVGATLRVATGFPATTPIGLRVDAVESPDRPGTLVPAMTMDQLPIWTVDLGDVSNLGRGRLPVYARLDLRLTFKPRNPAGRWQVYVEVLNALNRENVSQLEPVLEPDPTSDRPLIRYASDSGLPLLPSAGFRYRF